MLAKIRSTARSFSFPSWSIPIALLILTVLSYGLRSLSLGFFWDDWPNVWYFHRFGAAGIIEAFREDRPFLSLIYTISLTLLGDSIQGWQIFGVLAHWLYNLGFWLTLSLVWPRQTAKVTLAAFLFVVYPGFTQHWITVVYGQAYVLFAFFFFSLSLTLWLARRRELFAKSPAGRGLLAGGTVLAVALSAFTMFSTEYFFGLELLRPVLLWLVFINQQKEEEPSAADSPAAAGPTALSLWKRLGQRAEVRQAARAAVWWAPYLALMVVFVFWRSFIHVFPGKQLSTLDSITQSPLHGLVSLGLMIFEDLVEASLAAWGQVLQLSGFIENGAAAGLRLAAVIVIVGLLTYLYLSRLCPRSAPENGQITSLVKENWGLQAVLVGLFAMFAGGWPFWIVRLPMRMGFPQDRYTLPLSVGVCLLAAGLLDLVGKDTRRKAVLAALAVGLAAGFHFNTALEYRQDWNLTRDFFWQLTWRAPAIAENTLLLTDSLPFQFSEDDSLTAPLNWTYDPEGRSDQMKLMLYDVLVRKPDLESGSPIEKSYRAAQFRGSASQVLVVYYAPPGCVKVLNPAFDSAFYQLPARLLKVMDYSNPAAIITDQNPPASPPAEIFGSEPKHRWCYYYEKAELARQNEQWDVIRALAGESIKSGYRPEDMAEYLPFIEGYARTYFWDDAAELTRLAHERAPELSPALCGIWRRSEQTQVISDDAREVINQMDALLNCSAH